MSERGKFRGIVMEEEKVGMRERKISRGGVWKGV